MQVLLKNDVPNLGQVGDIKHVKNGYARNFLIPRGLVVVANAKNQKERAFLEHMQSKKTAKRRKEAEEQSKKLESLSVSIKAKLGVKGKLFGSITNIHVQKALAKKGILFDRKMILLEEPIRSLGIFQVQVRLYRDISIKVRVTITDSKGNIEAKASPDMAKAKASPDTAKAKASPDTAKAKASPDTTKTKASPDTTKAKASPDTAKAKASPDTEKAKASPDTEKAKASPDTAKAKASPDTAKAKASPDTAKATEKKQAKEKGQVKEGK